MFRATREELIAWGVALGAALRPPAVITLEGALGAGKTTLAQAIARGLGVTDVVTSPTYALVHEYAAPGFPVHHLDLYRLQGAHELENLAFDEIVGGPGVSIIEWPERAGDQLPAARRRIRLSHVPDDPMHRTIEEFA